MSADRDASADFKRRDASSYDEVTEEFDRFTERFTGGIAARVVREARLRPGERVLDVGSGTGVVTFKAAVAVGPAGVVTGIDLSDGMLQKARQKARQKAAAAAAPAEFLKMDAESLSFPDAAFDSVLSMFALRHFPRPEAALAEMRRVLRPGGRVVVAVGSGPSLLSRAGVVAAVRRAQGVLRALRGKSDLVACVYLDGLVERHLPSIDRDEEVHWVRTQRMTSSVPGMIRAAGFRDVRTSWEGNDGVVDTAQDFWDLQVTFSSIARKRLAQAPAATLDRIRREFDEGCARTLAAGGRLRYPTGAIIVAGTKGPA